MHQVRGQTRVKLQTKAGVNGVSGLPAAHNVPRAEPAIAPITPLEPKAWEKRAAVHRNVKVGFHKFLKNRTVPKNIQRTGLFDD